MDVEACPLLGHAPPADDEVVLTPGAIDVREAGALQGFELAVKAKRAHVVSDDEVAAGSKAFMDALEQQFVTALGFGWFDVVPDEGMEGQGGQDHVVRSAG